MTLAAGTLALWESLESAPPAARGAVVLVSRGELPDLATAWDAPLSAAASAALDELRERTGDAVETVLACSACGDPLDVALSLSALDEQTRDAPAIVRIDGAAVHAPTTGDVVAALGSPDPRAALRARCVELDTGADPRALADEVAAATDLVAGAAAAVVAVSCPVCGARTDADVDVVGLLQRAVEDEARLVLGEVAELAARFGWTEREVLGLSELRRRSYLAIARGEA